MSTRAITLAWIGLALVGALFPQDLRRSHLDVAWACGALRLPALTGASSAQDTLCLARGTGLRETALPLGLSVLEATEDVGLAIEDILRHGKDPVIRREFEAIRARIDALGLPPEEALVQHAIESGVPAFHWLAQYTRTLKR